MSVEDKKARMTELLNTQNAISKEINDTYLGRTERVIVDSVDTANGRNIYSARTLTNKLVHFESDKNMIGEFINVKITKIGAFDLFAEVEN